MEHNNNNLYLVFVALFIGACISLAGGVWYSLSVLSEYREEYDIMVSERDNFSENMDSLKAKNTLLKRIVNVNFSNSSTASDSLEFYANVRQAIEKNNLNMISMSTNSSMMGGESANVLNIKLQGDYYALAHLFADWRNMPFASRVTSLQIVRDQTSPEYFVDVDVTLEAWTDN